MENGYHQPQTSEDSQSEFQTGSVPEKHSKTFIEFVMRVRRRVRQVPLVLCLMILTSFFQAGQSVWSLSIPHQVYIVSTVSRFCDGMDLTLAQRDYCLENREYMASIRDGANLAIKQCQYQFQYRRWNCSVPERNSDSLFRRITGKGTGTKEAAFTYAITSAAVVHSIARACVGGNLSVCGCSRERRPEGMKKEHQWGGCGDNIAVGVKQAEEFLNTAGEESGIKERDSGKLERTLMNLHNNKVGIQVVKQEAKVSCKCHGLSGSCNIKTCQRYIAEFREIGNILHQKYNNALRVKMEKATKTEDKLRERNVLHVLKKRKKSGRRRDNGKLISTKEQPSNEALVFTKESPDFCVRSSRHEVLGTVGRICSTESYGTDSCQGPDGLCCGRGYRSQRVELVQRCKCKFHWCCEIRCKRCEKVEIRHMCR